MLDDFDLNGKRILITGASSGIGRAVAVRASRAGAKLLLTGRDEKRLDESLSLLAGDGHTSFAFDLLKLDDIEAKFADELDKFGKLSGFVYSAGVTDMILLRDTQPERFDEIMQINLLGFVMAAKAVCRRGRYENNLSVVALASVSAEGSAGIAAYAASKGALISAVKTFASEYVKRGVRFNCVSPAPVHTAMVDGSYKLLGDDWFKREVIDKVKLGAITPDDVANAVIFLLSDASRMITGANLPVDGGWLLR